MYLHPNDHLMLHHASARERGEATARESLVRRIRHAQRQERWARRSLRLADYLARRARTYRAGIA